MFLKVYHTVVHHYTVQCYCHGFVCFIWSLLQFLLDFGITCSSVSYLWWTFEIGSVCLTFTIALSVVKSVILHINIPFL